MKKLICILASAALLGACEQKTDVVVPSQPTDGATVDKATARARAKARKENEATNTITTGTAVPAVSTETKTESAATPNQ